MNVYDFDRTIYNGDSEIDFYFFLIKKKPELVRYLPKFLISAVKYKLHIIEKTEMKETFCRYLRGLKSGEVDKYVTKFWEKNKYKIYKWYLNHKNKNDVIISAGPRFVLETICNELGVSKLICSEVDKNNGIYISKNCRDVEKVKRFREEFNDATIDEFYSDSDSDLPLAKLAKKTYKIKKNGEVTKWDIK